MSFNGKSTLEKGGRDPPNKSLEYIVNDLLTYLYKTDKYHDAKKEAEDKYGIKKEQDDCWPADDIKRAWGKTQRLEETSTRRRHWSLVIMMQVIERQIKRKEQSDLMEAGNVVQRYAEMSVNDTPDQMKAGKRREIGEDDLGSTGDIDHFGNEKRRKEHPEDRSSQSTAKQGIMAAARAVKQHSGGKRQISSSGQTGGVSQGLTGTPNTVRSQRTGNNRGGFNRHGEPAVELIQTRSKYSSKTTYIRVPFSEIIPNEQPKRESVKVRCPYKLINRLPGPPVNSEIRRRKSYVMSFNSETMNANWVYEILNGETLVENPVRAELFVDPYDRGHLAAAANHRWCREAYDDADMIDNIVPQHQGLNRGPWKSLEFICRSKAKDQHIRNVHVYSGPIYRRDMNPRVIQGKRVPSHFFKVIIEEYASGKLNQPQCYLFPNVDLRTHPNQNLLVRRHPSQENLDNLEQYGITIEEIQGDSRLTFIDIRQNAETREIADAREIIGKLHGVDGNTEPCTAEIRVIICN